MQAGVAKAAWIFTILEALHSSTSAGSAVACGLIQGCLWRLLCSPRFGRNVASQGHRGNIEGMLVSRVCLVQMNRGLNLGLNLSSVLSVLLIYEVS